MYSTLIIYWIFFGLLHSLLAAVWCKKLFQSLMGKWFRYYRFLYSVFAFVTLGLILWYHFSLPVTPLWKVPVWLQIILLVSGLTGIGIMIKCIGQYFFYLSGIDVFFSSKAISEKLETKGLHRFVRHPLYFGTLLTIWSVCLLFPSISNLITTVMITLYTWIGTIFEEQKLRKDFGERYRKYQREVPMFIPFLKGKPVSM